MYREKPLIQCYHHILNKQFKILEHFLFLKFKTSILVDGSACVVCMYPQMHAV